MMIVGAGGFARELLDVCIEAMSFHSLVFFDNVHQEGPHTLYSKYPILHSDAEAQRYFEQDVRFILGLGNPAHRKNLCEKMETLGGKATSVFSPKAVLGQHELFIDEGTNILHFASVANGSVVGKGCLIYHHAQITHDCKLGDFCEISPGAILLGGCSLGDGVQVGAHATILPGVHVGRCAVVGAGAVVTADVPENTCVVGVPARPLQK
jgi:sugar O-acyltransferase (sialic acid O-acetyltransferase NeuD family)